MSGTIRKNFRLSAPALAMSNTNCFLLKRFQGLLVTNTCATKWQITVLIFNCVYCMIVFWGNNASLRRTQLWITWQHKCEWTLSRAYDKHAITLLQYPQHSNLTMCTCVDVGTTQSNTPIFTDLSVAASLDCFIDTVCQHLAQSLQRLVCAKICINQKR